MPTKILYSRQQIIKRLEEVAEQIANDYQGKHLILISILKGSFIVTADLLRALYKHGMQAADVEFMRVTSYGNSHKSSRNPKILTDITADLKDKHVLLIEDIIDTGHTLAFVKQYLQTKNPSSIKIFALLDKKQHREVAVNVDYTGFVLKNSPWVEGYGLDSSEAGRGNPDIIER